MKTGSPFFRPSALHRSTYRSERVSDRPRSVSQRNSSEKTTVATIARRGRDRVVEEQTTRRQQTVDMGEVFRVARADVLEHLDARHLVELALDGAIVQKLDRHAVGQSCGGDAFAGELVLLLAERYAQRLDAVLLGGVVAQRAPSAPDVEQALAWSEPKFAADVLELVLLRSGEVVAPAGK